MSRVVREHKYWLIPVCILIAGLVLLFGMRQIHAQPQPTPDMGAMPPGTPAPAGVAGGPAMPGGGPGAASSAPAVAPKPAEPTLSFSAVQPGGVTVAKIKNWDGTVTQLLRFKYKTMAGNVVSVHLPVSYKKDQRTKACWDCLFRTFAMDEEARIDAFERQRPPDMSPYISQFMAEIRGEVPEGTTEMTLMGDTNSSSAALDFARGSISSMGMQLPPMPTALPGMF